MKTNRISFILSVILCTLLPQLLWAATETITIEGKSFYVLRNSSDWDFFCQKVTDAKGNSDVNAIMAADFSTVYSVGRDKDSPYRGIFDGNGHTLNVEISGGSLECTAPFLNVRDCSIRNLRVTGNVSGANYSGGLIGRVEYSGHPEVHIDRVWVSANVISSSIKVSGMIGHASQGYIYMNDCRYDGNLTSTDYKIAIVYWDSDARIEMHRVYEMSTANNTNHFGYCYFYNLSSGKVSAWGGDAVCSLLVSSHNWAEVNADYRSVTDQNLLVSKMNSDKNNTWQMSDGKAAPIGSYFPEINFETYDFVPGTEKGEEGRLKIPFSCDQPVEWIEGSYIGEGDKPCTIKRESLAKNTYAGFILLPATEQHKNLKLNIKLQDGLIIFGQEVKSDAVMHNPRNLTAELLHFTPGGQLADAGAVELKWEVKDPGYADVLSGDQFVVMRSLTGKMADMQTIGSMVFDDKVPNYTYKDNTLTYSLAAEHINETKTIAQVRYLVVRGSAQQLWGLETEATDTASVALRQLHLLRVADYKADWQDEAAKTVKVTWRYATEAGAVWDSRATMDIVVSTTNKAGAAVDTTTYALTLAEMTACQKVLQLSRSCVDYKIAFQVEQGESPIPAALDFFSIRTAQDWQTFRGKVAAAKGQYNVNASLMADITVENAAAYFNDEAYSGIFEGNGHTLNVNITHNSLYTAVFRFVKNAIISNLNVTGSISSSDKYTAGLAAIVLPNGSLTVENCRVSAAIIGNINGDATNGGFVGVVRDGANIAINNSLFDGSFEGGGCHSNGGFIGNIDADGEAEIKNSLFAPVAIKTQLYNCSTWARHGDGGKLTLINCHSKTDYTDASGEKDGVFFIKTTDDWNTFCDKVIAVGGNSDVNAILTADITISKMVGADKYYRGTFDGNGHIITANINDNGNQTAPFKMVAGNSVIRNLIIKGTVTGNDYTSGLVGHLPSHANAHVTIENCEVAANVVSKKRFVSGFAGYNGTSYITINNCLFSGKLTVNSSEYSRFGGAFAGFSVENGTTITNCLENGTYENCTNTGAYFNVYEQACGGTNNWTYKESGWSELSHLSNKTPEEVVAVLGEDNWVVSNGVVKPKTVTNGYIGGGDVSNKTDDEIIALMGDGWTKDTNGHPAPKMENNQQADIDIPTFYYENIGRIDKKSLNVQTLQTSTLLTWANIDDNPVDYYDVWRYDKQLGKWEKLDSLLTEMQYEDKKTSPVHQYIYKVRGVTSCEGDHYDETAEVEGMCVQTATVEGHLCFLDGSGIPGKKVKTTVNNQEVSFTTDESGFFRLSGLPYVDGKETPYQLAVVGIMGIDPVTVTFGTAPGDNLVKGQKIEVTQSVKLSGNVMYDGTSIPVQGVSFKVDGYEVHTAGGKVETDHEGKFAFRILPGDHDSIQVVKDGHVFWRDGFYHESDDDPDAKKAYSFTTDKAGLMFYDNTRVKLTGRVVGGKTEGDMPLGYALSKNNLGDDIQMVFTLEGDNASRLVFDIQDRNKKERDEVFVHQNAVKRDGKYPYQTKVHTTLNRMVVTPDVHTGEYEVLLPPVKWKIQQINAKGYATLFQDGQVGDVIDLSDSITLHRDTLRGKWKTIGNGLELTTVVEEYHAKYSRIYHSPVIIDYKQQGFGDLNFLGDQYYTFKNVTGDKQKLPLVYGVRKKDWPVGKSDSLETHYTFGHPVFSIDKKYPLRISASEKYYYNNNTKSDTVDVVHIPGGVVTIHNGLVDPLHRDTVQLDSIGQGNYVMTAAQKPYLLTGDDALQTMSMTLLQDGTYYEATPIRAYVFNVMQATGAKDVLNYSVPQLVDILRDPPGGKSYATLKKGSSVSASYIMNMEWKGGLIIGGNVGMDFKTTLGLILAPMGVGSSVTQGLEINAGVKTGIDMVFSGSGERAFNYSMTAAEDISTSSDAKMVGADADVYIGVVNNIEVKPATAIRAIPDSTFRKAEGLLTSGRMVEIAQGQDNQGNLLHLVRDEVLTYGQKFKSNFVHSQHYITKQLIPELTRQCQSLMFTGTKDEAQAQANVTGKPVYWSKVSADNDSFGAEYEMIKPTVNTTDFEDEVSRYHQNMLAWMNMIARNEKEKLSATELLANYDVDGGSTVNYSETFTSQYTSMTSMTSPFSPITDGYFDGGLANAAAAVGSLAAKLLGLSKGAEFSLEIKGMGGKVVVSLTPVASFDVKPMESETKTYNRTESFSIGMDKRSHLVFDVYKVMNTTDKVASTDFNDVFVGNNFWDQVDYNKEYMKRDLNMDDMCYPRSFVYRTRGGATCRPWEDQRTTIFHRAGTELDVRTKKIENPQIKMDRQSISGVPFSEPARFKLYMTNESEQPEAAYYFFDIYQLEKSNPDGAKMFIDGMPLTGNMRTIEVRPGQVTEKTLEVYAGEKFDYEGLKIGIISQNDLDTYQTVAFDVHYLQTAGSIAITSPGDKWIMNCDAPFEKGKGWYLPVIIGNFDKNQHNFDHIEFQYKETTRGDDYWTNLCGYYADSTIYRAASGTKAMIPENGNIVTRFFGEGQEMEKGYDLRAVLFCRNGNAYITSESKVLSGVKDTRRPQLFGTPQPKTGVVGAGDNIVFDFSEDIEYNYLQATTNFEVLGETNETAIQEAPSLQFGGVGYAMTQSRRNFADKSITLEVMIKPDESNSDMPIFSHGSDGKSLQLWLTKEKHLKAIVDNGDELYTLESAASLKLTGYQRVALVLDRDRKQLLLYGDEQMGKLDSVTYSGYGYLTFGYSRNGKSGNEYYYKGRMLQGRLWYRALDLATLNRYGGKLLTGYEMGLADYYPMNDGNGKYAIDQAQGAHLMLEGVSWAQPEGMSLKLDANKIGSPDGLKGLQLQSTLFQRDGEQDYTLMFWFRTAGENGALLSNGSGRAEDEGALNKFFVGFEDDILVYRSNGNEYHLGDNLNNDTWHHYAMTVNRMHNVATIYIDNTVRAQFATDTLGGMLGTHFFLGNMVWQKDGDAEVRQANAFNGYFDGLTLFEQALPSALIKRYSNKSPGGEERGLIVYIPFDHQEQQKGGELVLQPYAMNKVVKYDQDGMPTEQRDSVFVNSVSEILARIDRNVGAPMQAYEKLRKLKFDFVGRNNQLLVNIDEQDARINKQNVYVTLFDIPDKNGNFMASPATETFFVNRNPLRCYCSRQVTIYPDYDFAYTLELNIYNEGNKAHSYTIENLPRWLTPDYPSDIVEPLSDKVVTLTVSQGMEVGTYDQIIYVTDENGLTEPVYLEIRVEGVEPDWRINQDMKRYSMNIVAQVYVGNTLVSDSEDKVAAFDEKGRLMGVNNIKYDPKTERSMLFMTVYDSTTVASPLFFRLWHHATGKIMQLSSDEVINFGEKSVAGTVDYPVQLYAADLYQQTIDLSPGWNWISFNVRDSSLQKLSTVLSRFPWQEGDILTEDTEDLTLVYKNGMWMSSTGKNIKDMSLSQAYSYRVFVQDYHTIDFWGTSYKSEADRTMTLKPGWNSLGYTPIINLPVTTALTDYFSEALPGDVIKSQHEFAMFVADGKGSGQWLGSLEYMKPGEGYMFHRLKADTVTFCYPFYEAGITFVETSMSPMYSALPFAATMNIVAQSDGIDVEKGDHLAAYANGERVGDVVLSSLVTPLFYLSVAGDVEAPLSFAIIRNGEVVATTTGEVMNYKANAVCGSPSQPAKIRFIKSDVLPQNGWYTLEGIKLPNRPTRSGVYLYNGKKQVIH